MEVFIVRTVSDSILSVHSTKELAEAARAKYLEKYDTWGINILSGYIVDEMWEG